ncbi:unnamed protein product, partial [Ilex paraguariensis]
MNSRIGASDARDQLGESFQLDKQVFSGADGGVGERKGGQGRASLVTRTRASSLSAPVRWASLRG